MTIQEYLKERPLLFDGAMGTYLIEKYPQFAQKECELLNVTNPELVQGIHEEYLQAGAAAIKTNTFSADGRLSLEEAERRKIVRRGWEIANAAVGKYSGEHFVFADIGPVTMEEDKKAWLLYKENVDVFLECGAKYFLFETLESSEGLGEIFSYIKERVPESFIIASFAASPEGYTRAGFLAEKLFWQMQETDAVDAVGFNCISGPKHLLERIQRFSLEKTKKYVSVMPNAGYPTILEKRVYYGNNYDYYAGSLSKLVGKGVGIVGGCCGTTPVDIKNAKQELEKRTKQYVSVTDTINAARVEYREKNSGQEVGTEEIKGQSNQRNRFAQKLQEEKKVIVVELDPPLEPDIDFFMEGVARYKYAGVDAIDIADCPIAKARIDSSILACKITREMGMTAIPHMTCRDRNLNATKALLLGLNIEGVNNVLTVTGDPVPAAMRNQIKTMFSYNSAVLSQHIQVLNQEIFRSNPFMVSGALNINAVNFDSQMVHAKKKIENGMSVLFTQPVLSEKGFENLKRARKELPVKILGGIMPVVSYRNATFMNNEMAGITIQEEIVRMYEGKNREEGEELAYRISTRIIREIQEYVDGFYVITPFKRVDLILRLIGYIRKNSCLREREGE